MENLKIRETTNESHASAKRSGGTADQTGGNHHGSKSTGKGSEITLAETSKTLEFHRIIEMLKERALTEKARQRLEALSPILSETELECSIRETTEAREILEHMGRLPWCP